MADRVQAGERADHRGAVRPGEPARAQSLRACPGSARRPLQRIARYDLAEPAGPRPLRPGDQQFRGDRRGPRAVSRRSARSLPSRRRERRSSACAEGSRSGSSRDERDQRAFACAIGARDVCGRGSAAAARHRRAVERRVEHLVHVVDGDERMRLLEVARDVAQVLEVLARQHHARGCRRAAPRAPSRARRRRAARGRAASPRPSSRRRGGRDAASRARRSPWRSRRPPTGRPSGSRPPARARASRGARTSPSSKPRSAPRPRAHVSAAWPDSFITSPSWPVSTRPAPGVIVAST